MKKTLSLTCPVCGATFSVDHFSSYNLQEEGNDLSPIKTDAWVHHECPKCKNAITVLDIMVFHDMAKKLMIFFFPENSGTLEQHQTFVDKYDYPKGYTIRIVEATYNDFKEKILIFENGLNDCAVELYKSVIVNEKLKDTSIREAHILFDKQSIPQGFAFYTDSSPSICEAFDPSTYRKYIRKSRKYQKNRLVHYSSMKK